MPKAYWIARIDVRDPERYKDYISTSAPAFAEFGARSVVRGGAVTQLEGKARARNVVWEFDSVEQAKACYDSPAYQEALKIRQECSEAEMIIVEGVA